MTERGHFEKGARVSRRPLYKDWIPPEKANIVWCWKCFTPNTLMIGHIHHCGNGHCWVCGAPISVLGPDPWDRPDPAMFRRS